MSTSRPKPIEILLAEDEEHIAKLICFKLARDGFKVSVAKNGQDAVDQLGARPWSLVILDVMMPILNGWQVLESLKSSPASGTPVLMLTARQGQKDVARASELGATQFLSKPFDPAELSIRVKKLVQQKG